MEMKIKHDENFSQERWNGLERSQRSAEAIFAGYAIYFENPHLRPVSCDANAQDAFYIAFEHVIRAASAGEEFDVEVRPAVVRGLTLLSLAETFGTSSGKSPLILSIGPRLEQDRARYELLDQLIALARKRAS
jgi:hypothetical protein